MRLLILCAMVFFTTGCKEYVESNKDALKKTHDLKDQVNQKVKDLEDDAEELSEDDELSEGDE